MNEYFDDLEQWENSFSCGACGIDSDVTDFLFERRCANGEVWSCKSCGHENLVDDQPNEDNY